MSTRALPALQWEEAASPCTLPLLSSSRACSSPLLPHPTPSALCLLALPSHSQTRVFPALEAANLSFLLFIFDFSVGLSKQGWVSASICLPAGKGSLKRKGECFQPVFPKAIGKGWEDWEKFRIFSLPYPHY